MGQMIGALGVSSLRSPVATAPRRLVTDRRLLFLKAAGLAACVVLVAVRSTCAPTANLIADRDAGVELRYPLEWHAGRHHCLGVGACERVGDAYRSGPAREPPRGCCVEITRMAWSDFEQLVSPTQSRTVPVGCHVSDERVAAEVAAYLRLSDPIQEIARTTLGGRPALMVVGRRFRGMTVLVVARGPDLTFMHLYAPDAETFRRVGPMWRAMVRSARLTGPVEVMPRPQLFSPPDPHPL
jgi:hypothetical protein